MPFARSIVHPFVSSKTDAPDSSLLQPSDWNATHTQTISGAISGGIPYFDSTTSEATSALLAANGVVIGGGAGTAPFTSSSFTFNGTSVIAGDGAEATPAFRTASEATGFYRDSASSMGLSVAGGRRALLWTDGAYYLIGSGTVLGMGTTAAPDTGISRTAAGEMSIGTGAAGSAAGTMRAAAYKVGATAGASFGPGAVTSITVVNGIVTAIS